MSLWQGVKGAQVELAAIPNPMQKLRRLGSITKLFASELVSTIALAPFAVRALKLYKSLPSLDTFHADDVQPVYVVKDVRYGPAARSLVDLYVPSDAAASLQERKHPAAAGVPVVVFVHGGVWAAGDKWHYAPLASCLARLGVMACVVQYTLYPEALVPQLVEEVSAAFDWAMDNVDRYGGDRQQVSLVGHSAGAQLCMMALLQRAQTAHHLSQQQKQQPSYEPQQQQQPQQLPNMPKQFVAVTGVFDIAKHYTYEKERGVHELSTMKRAMGGFQHFAAQSPAVILGAALQQQQQQWNGKEQQLVGACGASHDISSSPQQQQQQQQQEQGCPASQEQEPPACGFYDSFQLSGESIAHRIGFDRGSSHHLASEASLNLQSLEGMAGVMQFPLAAACFLPPTVLISSCTDLTVPWYESAEMYWKLLDCGVPVKHLVYNKIGHGDFVVEWPTIFESPGSSDDWGGQGSSSNVQRQHSAAAAGSPQQHNSDADDWDTNGSTGNSTEVANVSNQAPAGISNADQLAQQRRHWLQELPHYCRDIAVVAMGQQAINFMQKKPSAASSTDVWLGSWQQQAVGVGADDSVPAAADAEMLVQAELN